MANDLFTPCQVGTLQLTHRVVLAPMSRYRCSKEMAPKGSFTITLEYFCFEHDELWSLEKNDLINLGIQDAVELMDNGYYAVNYNAIDVNMLPCK